MAQVREGSINAHEEMFILTRSGERREIAWNNTLLRDDAGRLIGSTSIGEDVTERNRATRRLLLQVQVARALAGSPSMDVARPLVLEHLTRALACWMGVFWRPEPDGTALTVDGVFLADPEDGAEFAAAVRELRLAPGEGIAGRAWRTRQPAWIPDLADDRAVSGRSRPTRADGPRGTLAFPIISGGEVILVLQLSSDDPTAPDSGTLEVLESTFQNVLQFAERREAEAAERRLAAEQAALRRVATLIAKGAEPEAVFQAVTSEVGHLFEAETANMVQYRPEGTSAILLGGWAAGIAALAPGDGARDGRRRGHLAHPRDRAPRADRRLLAAHGRPRSAGARARRAGRRGGADHGAGLPVGGDDRHLERGAVRPGHRDPHRRVHRPRRPGPLEHRRQRAAHGVEGAHRRGRETPSGAGSSETCTTAPSSGSSRSRWRCGWPGRASRPTPQAANALLEAASEELATALEELRELARGIHPAILTDRGLAPALEALAGRSPVPVAIHSLPEDRLPAQVEAAAYYVVSESLANVAKYAGASRVDVAVVCRDGWAFVEVADNGAGGADPARGSGLLGLADRVEALSGNLDVESPEGAGTRVRARIPLG